MLGAGARHGHISNTGGSKSHRLAFVNTGASQRPPTSSTSSPCFSHCVWLSSSDGAQSASVMSGWERVGRGGGRGLPRCTPLPLPATPTPSPPPQPAFHHGVFTHPMCNQPDVTTAGARTPLLLCVKSGTGGGGSSVLENMDNIFSTVINSCCAPTVFFVGPLCLRTFISTDKRKDASCCC